MDAHDAVGAVMAKKKKRGKFTVGRGNVGKGLTRAEALKKMLRKFPGDHRGFVYDPKTGWASIC